MKMKRQKREMKIVTEIESGKKVKMEIMIKKIKILLTVVLQIMKKKETTIKAAVAMKTDNNRNEGQE